MNAPVSIAVAVCTYRRPALLELVLGDLQQQVFSRLAVSRVTLFVIDNDRQESARSITTHFSDRGPFEVSYVVQPIKGLSSVRNQALACARSHDLLAFVDDDERIGSNWLDTLGATLISHSARFAIGPVRPLFPSDCSGAFVASGLFHRAEFLDGQRIYTGNTGNAILDMRFIAGEGIRFRSEFEQSGGEDTCFFADITRAGGVGVYALSAVAQEPVALERLSVAWLMRRRCRFGTTEVIQAKMNMPHSLLVGARYVFSGISRILASVFMTVAAFPFNRGKALKFACAGARGYGYVIGALGWNIEEY
jgi:succinoglycan biosynthesis protein ExoM